MVAKDGVRAASKLRIRLFVAGCLCLAFLPAKANGCPMCRLSGLLKPECNAWY